MSRRGTRARKRTPKAERPSTPLEVAEAVIHVHEQGGNRVTVGNPFFQDTGSRDTLHYVACGLDVLGQSDLKAAAISRDTSFGLSLILRTFEDALRGAIEQIEHEQKYAKARATVEALKGGAK